MILNEYVIEKQLVNKFIEHTFDYPLLINGKARKIFIWGHEILLPDGKGSSKSGILDLIGTDELGEVWLIEAKLSSNTEWHSNIWQNQLGLYAISLKKRSEQEIVLGSRRYIKKRSTGTVFPPYIISETSSLSDAFCQWASHLNYEGKKGLELYDITMDKIRNGSFIQCVLSNEPGHEIWKNRPKDITNAMSYITFNKDETDVLLEQNRVAIASTGTGHWSHETWETFMKKKNEIKPTTDKIPLLLADSVVPIYEKIIDFFTELGWSGEFHTNKKAFRFDLQTIYNIPLRIHIGWIDADGQQDIKYRTPYQFGLKFNIDFRHFKKDTDIEVWEVGYVLAKELAEKARYNIRGGEFSITDNYWTAEKVKDFKWDGEMYRFITKSNKDYIGLEEEYMDLKEVFQFLNRVIKT
ncbi:hypothetical protein GPDM_03090 [Planococcus donghaensis MPA1U2]|uniref:Uncharacterized protein n=1 Tax=Planococcus donghaensis MPA1U2 TaxID=933115 RepID=E7RDU0_9BACL|nr:hypothetical protein [Planococcus donghaensis]EGA90846.1 hypothetical protein GPDM_03090 [Planococcus donghaensis MPA1U2]